VDQTPPGCALEFDARCQAIRLITAARLLTRVGCEDEARTLLAALREKRLTEVEAARIVAEVRGKGLAEKTREAARGYIDAALRELDALPASPERAVLAQAAEYVLTRRK